jgi:hypothetical protein
MAHAAADNRQTRGLADFVSGLRYERIPEEVRTRLKLLMLELLRLEHLEDSREVVQTLALPLCTGRLQSSGGGGAPCAQ